MSETAPVEALRAFAQTKPTEFDGFMVAWNEKHPVMAEPIVVIELNVEAEPKQVDEPLNTPKKKSKVATSD